MRPYCAQKIIITDADGTIVWWLKGFISYMQEKGFALLPGMEDEYRISKKFGVSAIEAEALIREFNEGPWIADLHPFADAVEYIGKLVNHGFKFILVTAQSDAPSAKVHRTANMQALFGDAFLEINCIEMGANKKEFLSRWKDSGYFWIEDHFDQAMAGYNVGLRPILIKHPYNVLHHITPFPQVSVDTPWAEIYKIICSEYYIAT